MGRQLRRVPIDFDHPVGETWGGFLNPHYGKCGDCQKCGGDGYSPTGKKWRARWYGDHVFIPDEPFRFDHPTILELAKRNVERVASEWALSPVTADLTFVYVEARRLAKFFNHQWCHHLDQGDVDALVAEKRLPDFTHRPRTPEQAAELKDGEYWLKEPNGYVPTAAEVNEWSLRGFGHDSINQWVCVKARCAREGKSETCSACDGTGESWESEEAKAVAEAWQPEEPPVGDGYQMWETVSEGSPISPVFATPEELARYLVANARGVDEGTSYETWLKFIQGPGWAPSLVSFGGKVITGVESIVSVDRA